MKILIIKHGALGDVVRMSYFPRSIIEENENLSIYWKTSSQSLEILTGNPYIKMVTDSYEDLKDINFEVIYSFDDEIEVLKSVMELKYKRIVGAFIRDGKSDYTEDSSRWFDMGLLSKYGKEKADKLKKQNELTYGEIFSEIINVNVPVPQEYMNIKKNKSEKAEHNINVGINPFAGKRWPSKELGVDQLVELIKELLKNEKIIISLFGQGEDEKKNLDIGNQIKNKRVKVVNTEKSISILSYKISQMDYMITTDSLAMHLSISNRIPFVAFFNATSAAEIDTYGLGVKIKSTASDYCSYTKNADSTTITARRILEGLKELGLIC